MSPRMMTPTHAIINFSFVSRSQLLNSKITQTFFPLLPNYKCKKMNISFVVKVFRYYRETLHVHVRATLTEPLLRLSWSWRWGCCCYWCWLWGGTWCGVGCCCRCSCLALPLTGVIHFFTVFSNVLGTTWLRISIYTFRLGLRNYRGYRNVSNLRELWVTWVHCAGRSRQSIQQ